jgi:hypothetical protein
MQHPGSDRHYSSAKCQESCGGCSGRSPSGCSAIRMAADELVSLAEPAMFLVLSQWYEDFTQISDEDVQRLLERAAGSLSRAA